MSGLRQPPINTTIYNVATDITADVEFLCKLTQLAYVADKPNHILHDRRWYAQTTHQDTYRSMMTLSQTNRRVLYERHFTYIDSILIYTPINVNNVISNDLTIDLPIYVIFRGTDSIWDVFKDLNLLYNYTTGSHYDASGIQSLVSSIGNYLETQIFNSYSENIVFLSHSLGSKIALNVMDGFKDTIHINRIKHNVMFNPFIVVDNIYENALDASNDYKSKFEAFIIDGDFASIIYKNHPIGALYTYGNIVPEGSWIQEIQTLTRQQYLNVQNHNLNAFTNSIDSFPQTTYVHYEPDALQDKQISSLRTFSLTGFDSTLTQEQIYLRKKSTETEWKVGNINVDSNHLADYDIDIRIASDGKTDMIWKNGYWSYPLEFGLMVNGSLTWDLSNIFYMVRAYNEQSEQSYYMIGIFNNDIKYYRTRFVTDYSIALTNQDKKNLSNAFALESQAQLTQAQSLGQTSLTHQAYRWFINNPDLPNHTGYSGGLRRSLITLEHNALVNSVYSPISNWDDKTYTIHPHSYATRSLQTYNGNGADTVTANVATWGTTVTPGNTWFFKNLDIVWTDSTETTINYILVEIESVEETGFTVATNIPPLSDGNFYSTNYVTSIFNVVPQIKLVPATDLAGNYVMDSFNIINNSANPLKHHDQWSTSGTDPVYWDDNTTITSSGVVAYMWKFTEV